MLKSLLVIVCLYGTFAGSTAAGISLPAAVILAPGDTLFVESTDSLATELQVVSPDEYLSSLDSVQGKKENKKLIASVLAVALGPFGAHRIYLGSGHIVPLVYVLTLGGGLGVLPAIDLAVMLFSKDMTPYENNRKFFMWIK